MPHYHKLGTIPHKRHIQFRKPDGSLYSEQLVSTEGFSDVYSNVYHNYPPTQVISVEEPFSIAPEIAVEKNMICRSFLGFNIKPVSGYLESRVPVLVNSDVYIHLSAPTAWQSLTLSQQPQQPIHPGTAGKYFFKNSDAHELIFVHEGSGKLKTIYGVLDFRPGDHVIIPRGVIYQLDFDDDKNRLFIVESFSPFKFPKRYINRSGQLLEHAPFCERDIRKPEFLETHDEKGDFLVLVKRDDVLWPYHYASHPFDVVGWDGFHYPYALSIHDFEPITGRIHQPPPVHQTFDARNFVMCAFVPRMYDYHPLAIPAPYYHSNVDSDEVLYYVEGQFMSRKNVERGMISLHPIGIPHGPHPGMVEKSIGKTGTEEIAVMVDTFKPLKITKQALDIEDRKYFRSWVE